MTKEQFEKCQAYEKELRWAGKSNFVHMTNTEFSEIAKLYKEIYGEGLTLSQMTCNTCRLRAMKRIYEDFEKYQQEIAKEQKEDRITKKKAGRPPKIDINA